MSTRYKQTFETGAHSLFESDTILLAAKSQIVIKLQGYAGSTFLRKQFRTRRSNGNLSMRQPGPFIDSSGTEITIATGGDSSAVPVQLKVTIDTVKQHVASGWHPRRMFRYFLIVQANRSPPLMFAELMRASAAHNDSALSQAEFIAEGVDANKNCLPYHRNGLFSRKAPEQSVRRRFQAHGHFCRSLGSMRKQPDNR